MVQHWHAIYAESGGCFAPFDGVDVPVGHAGGNGSFADAQDALDGGPDVAVEHRQVHEWDGDGGKRREGQGGGVQGVYGGDFPAETGGVQVEFHV